MRYIFSKPLFVFNQISCYCCDSFKSVFFQSFAANAQKSPTSMFARLFTVQKFAFVIGMTGLALSLFSINELHQSNKLQDGRGFFWRRKVWILFFFWRSSVDWFFKVSNYILRHYYTSSWRKEATEIIFLNFQSKGKSP